MRVFGKLYSIAIPVVAAILLCCSCTRSPKQQYARYLESAEMHSARGDHARAILDLRNATKAQPHEAEAYYRIGLEYLSTNQRREAIGALRRATDISPQHKPSQLKLVELQLLTQNEQFVKDAQSRVQKLLTANPTDDDALLMLAASDIQLGNEEEAEKVLSEILERSPQHTKAALALAQMKISTGDLKAAEETLQQACSGSPSPDPLIALGVLYTREGKIAAAERTLREAIRIAPANAAALSALGVSQSKAGQTVEAEHTYKQLSLLPEREHKLAYVAFLMQHNRGDAAVVELERLRNVDRGDRSIRNALVTAYVATNRPARAEEILDDTLKSNSKDIDALIQRSEIYLQKGKVSEAQLDLAEVFRNDPGSWQAHFVMAKVHRAHDAGLQERQELSEALRRNSQSLHVRIALTKALLRSGDAQAALATLNDAPAPQKQTIPYLVTRNWALMSLGDLAEARKTVQALLAIVNIPEVLLQDGLLKLAAKDFIRARISLEDVVKTNPEDLRAVAALCETYVAEKQLKAGTNRLREIASQRPKYVPLQMFWANWLLHNGDKHEARKTLYAAKAADPQNTDPDLLLARIAYAERDIEAAHRSLAAVISRHPTNAEAQMLEGMTDEVSNDFAGAIEHYKKVVETNDHHVGALNNLAYVLSRNPTTLDEALKHAQKARELSPENPYIQDTLGWIYYRKGLYTMAVKELEGALAGQVTPAIQFHLGLAYKTVGKVDKSKQLITAALAADPRLLQDSLP